MRSGAAGTRPMAGPERGRETQRLCLPWAPGLQAVRSLPAGPCPVVSGPPWPSLSSPPPAHAGPYPARARVDVAAPGGCRLLRKGQEVCRSQGSQHRVWPSRAPAPPLQGLLPGGDSGGTSLAPGPPLPPPAPACASPALLRALAALVLAPSFLSSVSRDRLVRQEGVHAAPLSLLLLLLRSPCAQQQAHGWLVAAGVGTSCHRPALRPRSWHREASGPALSAVLDLGRLGRGC